uniref:3-deoxy-manno-octulosonate cytidylyltransferase n=1 Tax=uncultured Clostridium sp. TaxID=59620 RepID=UPI0025EA84E3
IVGIIPARYKSSRFEGKPLADICGKPMIYWVYNQVIKVDNFEKVYVATDDVRIESVCKKYSMNVIMTSELHKTGTDRLAEVAEKIDADLYVNIQGDEPLIEPETIVKAIEPFYNNKENIEVSNLMTKIKDPVDVVNCTIPKVITNRENIGIFLTRSASPYPKGSLDYSYYKQVCVYGFSREALKFFKRTPRGKIEKIEDIEILRFIENGIKVQYVEVETNSIAVDTPKDLERVKKYMEAENNR